MGKDTILFLHNIHWGFRFLYLLNKVFPWKYNKKYYIPKEKKVRLHKQDQINKKSSKLHKLQKVPARKEIWL